MIMNKTTKKLQPIFLLKSSKTKKKAGEKVHSTLRILPKEDINKTITSICKNEPVVSKLIKLVIPSFYLYRSPKRPEIRLLNSPQNPSPQKLKTCLPLAFKSSAPKRHLRRRKKES